jgi:hypothetical protein
MTVSNVTPTGNKTPIGHAWVSPLSYGGKAHLLIFVAARSPQEKLNAG